MGAIRRYAEVRRITAMQLSAPARARRYRPLASSLHWRANSATGAIRRYTVDLADNRDAVIRPYAVRRYRPASMLASRPPRALPPMCLRGTWVFLAGVAQQVDHGAQRRRVVAAVRITEMETGKGERTNPPGPVPGGRRRGARRLPPRWRRQSRHRPAPPVASGAGRRGPAVRSRPPKAFSHPC